MTSLFPSSPHLTSPHLTHLLIHPSPCPPSLLLIHPPLLTPHPPPPPHHLLPSIYQCLLRVRYQECLIACHGRYNSILVLHPYTLEVRPLPFLFPIHSDWSAVVARHCAPSSQDTTPTGLSKSASWATWIGKVCGGGRERGEGVMEERWMVGRGGVVCRGRGA